MKLCFYFGKKIILSLMILLLKYKGKKTQQLSAFAQSFKQLIILLLVIIVSKQTDAQDSITVDYLLDKIETQQLKRNDFFIEGVFPSYINASQKFKTKKKDNTIFYNTLVAYVLKDNYNKF